MSVKFDNVEILDSEHAPRFIKHESVAERIMGTLPVAREDGDVLIMERYGQKRIVLRGTLSAASEAALDAAIDEFNELFSRPAKELEVSWSGGTRIFIATCKRHEFDRDHFNINFVPWTAEFIVPSGEGRDESTTKPAAADGDTVPFVPGGPLGTTSFTIEGSKPPLPVVTLGDIDGGTLVKGIEYKNTDTGERLCITYPGDWGNDRTIEIDFEAKTVRGDVVDGVMKDLDFFGVFPHFNIGTNNFAIRVGGITNQKSADDELTDLSSSTELLSSTTRRWAMGFQVPYRDETFYGIILALKKTGTPGTLTWRIETDDGSGNPSGSLVNANATGTITAGDVTTSMSYIRDNGGGAFTLEANTPYHLVFGMGATADASNRYDIGKPQEQTYPRGRLRLSDDSGATYAFPGTKDISFRILFGGGEASEGVTHDVEYYRTWL